MKTRRDFLRDLGITVGGAGAVITLPAAVLASEDGDFDLDKEWPKNICRLRVDGRDFVVFDGDELVLDPASRKWELKTDGRARIKGI